MRKSRLVHITLGAVIAGLLGVAGCHSPMERASEQELRDEIITSHRAFLQAVAGGGVIEIRRQPSEMDLKLSPERREALDKDSGPDAISHDTLVMGSDLMAHNKTDAVTLSLRRAVDLAIRNNIDVQVAKVAPAITETQYTQAEAAFDSVFFSSYDLSYAHTPLPPPVSASNTIFGSSNIDTDVLSTGIRKPLSTGGTITVQTDAGWTDDQPTEYYRGYWDTADVSLNLTQPLLRNFGSDVTRSQVELARSARKESVEDLRSQLMTTAQTTEQDYWQLVNARQNLQVQERLLSQTIKDEEQLQERSGFDVSPVRLTEAQSYVSLRTSDLIRAQEPVRLASDTLKRQINAPELQISGETLILPIESAPDAPLSYSLLDAVTTAINHRPDLAKALMQIEDSSTRQRVADNGRLPLLNLNATLRYNGISDINPNRKTSSASGTPVTTDSGGGSPGGLGGAYQTAFSASYIDYLITLQFEVPIGNRGPEAAYRLRQLEKRASVLSYQKNVQDTVLEVKNSLRQIQVDFELIDSTRAARRAAADNLRALLEQEKSGVALTPEFLMDLKLSTEQRLADAENQEIQALTDYATAISKFYQAIGTILERDGVDFKDPEDTILLRPDDAMTTSPNVGPTFTGVTIPYR